MKLSKLLTTVLTGALGAILFTPTQSMADLIAPCQKTQLNQEHVDPDLKPVLYAACGTAKVRVYPFDKLSFNGYSHTYNKINGVEVREGNWGEFWVKRSGLLNTRIAANGQFYGKFWGTLPPEKNDNFHTYYLVVRATRPTLPYDRTQVALLHKSS